VVIAGGVKAIRKLTGNTNMCGIRKTSGPEPERRTTCMRLHIREGVSGDSEPRRRCQRCTPSRRRHGGSGNHEHRVRLVERKVSYGWSSEVGFRDRDRHTKHSSNRMLGLGSLLSTRRTRPHGDGGRPKAHRRKSLGPSSPLRTSRK
jgi:hypothetical protein